MSFFKDQELLDALVNALKTESSALGTYFRSLPRGEIKDLFCNESDRFLECGINAMVHLEDYELCAVFREILDDRKVHTHSMKIAAALDLVTG